MTTTENQLQSTLSAGGFSLTKPRQTIFAALQAHGPLSMGRLISLTSQQTDRASVYRTIGLFEQLGICQRLQTGWKYAVELSDSFQPHHHHMYCTSCEQTIELAEDEQLESRLHALAAGKHFQPHSHQLEVRGICAACQASQAVQQHQSV